MSAPPSLVCTRKGTAADAAGTQVDISVGTGVILPMAFSLITNRVTSKIRRNRARWVPLVAIYRVDKFSKLSLVFIGSWNPSTMQSS